MLRVRQLANLLSSHTLFKDEGVATLRDRTLFPTARAVMVATQICRI